MKTLLSYLLIFFLIPISPIHMRVDTSQTELSIFGTSSIHDWEIEAKNCKGTAEVVYEAGDFTKIEQLGFKVEVASLKSGKSAMDVNTVEALKGKKYPYITYEFTEMELIRQTANIQLFDAQGTLTIAGTSQAINMKITIEDNSSSLFISGEVDLKMTDYKVDPPTAIFGTITTGDAVTIKFKTKYIQ